MKEEEEVEREREREMIIEDAQRWNGGVRYERER